MLRPHFRRGRSFKSTSYTGNTSAGLCKWKLYYKYKPIIITKNVLGLKVSHLIVLCIINYYLHRLGAWHDKNNNSYSDCAHYHKLYPRRVVCYELESRQIQVVDFTLLSYAICNYHISICNHSGSFSNIALATLTLQSTKKLFQKGNLENKCMILILSGADVRAWSVGIDSIFSGIFPSKMKFNHSVLNSSAGGSLLCLLVLPKTHLL